MLPVVAWSLVAGWLLRAYWNGKHKTSQSTIWFNGWWLQLWILMKSSRFQGFVILFVKHEEDHHGCKVVSVTMTAANHHQLRRVWQQLAHCHHRRQTDDKDLLHQAWKGNPVGGDRQRGQNSLTESMIARITSATPTWFCELPINIADKGFSTEYRHWRAGNLICSIYVSPKKAIRWRKDFLQTRLNRLRFSSPSRWIR